MKLPEHKHFFGVHGKKAESLSDLRSMLIDMSEDQFRHHVNSDKNDFANWVRDILHRDYLAEKMMRVQNKSDTLDLVNDELLKDRELDLERSDEFKRFIAREFIYGMFFGIVIGLIISNLM